MVYQHLWRRPRNIDKLGFRPVICSERDHSLGVLTQVAGPAIQFQTIYQSFKFSGKGPISGANHCGRQGCRLDEMGCVKGVGVKALCINFSSILDLDCIFKCHHEVSTALVRTVWGQKVKARAALFEFLLPLPHKNHLGIIEDWGPEEDHQIVIIWN